MLSMLLVVIFTSVSSPKSEDQVESGLFLDVVVAQSPAILKLLSSENQSLLVWGNSFLVLNLLLHVLDGIRALHLEGDGLSSEGLYEYLHRVCCLELENML